MRFKNIVFLIPFISSTAAAQVCDCLGNMILLQQKVEANQASYQHQVVENNRFNAYLSFKTEVNQKATLLTSKKDCLGLISYYISFFRDEHSFISYMDDHTPDPNIVISAKNRKDHAPNGLDGLWYFQDGSFSIQILHTRTGLGERIGVIQHDRSRKWKKGQLKMEFFHDADGHHKCIYWRMNSIPKTFSVSFTDSLLKIGRDLIFYRTVQDVPQMVSGANDLHFVSLSQQTNYLRVPSFDLSYAQSIDSILTKHRFDIGSKRNLIIDIRNNGGGGFDAYAPLLPFVSDTDIIAAPYEGSVWVSAENYVYYDSTKYEYAKTEQDSIDELAYVMWLKANMGHFTPVENTVDTIVLEKNSPSTIALLFNRNTASTAEGFILQACNSIRVSTFGENSAGAVSYGDWIPIDLPELNIWVAVTTKKMVFRNGEDLESIGIGPDVYLTHLNEQEWLDQVLDQIEK